MNRKASFNYEAIEKFEAGIMLTGSEVKSIRASEVSIGEGFCIFKGDELFVKNMHIAPYKEAGNLSNHEPLRLRKLLLHRKQLNKLIKGIETKGVTIIPYKLYTTKSGIIKLEIWLSRGKKNFDKKNSIKEKDLDRETSRIIKNNE